MGYHDDVYKLNRVVGLRGQEYSMKNAARYFSERR
jgi:hypothetical protein